MAEKQKIIPRKESLKERALQIFNLRYLSEPDLKSSYKRRIFEYHPEKHPDIDDPKKLEEYEKKTKVINQAHDLLIDFLNGVKIDLNNYRLLEDTDLVQSLLPKEVAAYPLGETHIESWKRRYGDII